MVTEQSTYAIDAEFATYGPMAFDVCKMIANLLLAFFAADGLAATMGGSRASQQRWILQVLVLAALLMPAKNMPACTSVALMFTQYSNRCSCFLWRP